MRRRGGRLAAWCLAVFGILLAGGALGAADATPPLFRSTEIRNASLEPFVKWTGVLERYLEERAKVPGDCTEGLFNRCHYKRWQALVDRLRGRPLAEQLDAVNAEMNRLSYVLDPVNWGLDDYWASPGQFFDRYGDCEDYAITKFLTLKRLGLDPERMRIVVLQDLNLGIAHAVLAVYADGRIWILDNQINRVVEAATIRHYQPIFSINEQAWWLHRPLSG